MLGSTIEVAIIRNENASFFLVSVGLNADWKDSDQIKK